MMLVNAESVRLTDVHTYIRSTYLRSTSLHSIVVSRPMSSACSLHQAKTLWVDGMSIFVRIATSVFLCFLGHDQQCNKVARSSSLF